MKPQLTVDALFRQVEEAWRDASAGRATARRGDISPAKLKSALPYVSLVDVVPGDPIDFRYRLLGQRIIDGFGRNITGGLHSQHADRTSPIWPFYDAYRKCVATGLPQAIDHAFRNTNGVKVRMQAHVWPLSDDGDGDGVTGLLGAGMFLAPDAT